MAARIDDASASANTPPAARVAGETLAALPEDLYIPPDALRVFLEAFEGPLDLLLYLIRRQNLDILDIPVQTIAEQYIAYIELMQDMAIELAGEYLLMAVTLAEIKSRMLLPTPVAEEDDEGVDPRAELVRRLQEYEQFKEAGQALDALPRVGRDVVEVRKTPARIDVHRASPQPDLRALLGALRDVFERAELFSEHKITREPLSVRAHMSRILAGLDRDRSVAFAAVLAVDEGRLGVVVSFLAVLELARESHVVLEQDSPRAPLSMRRAGVLPR